MLPTTRRVLLRNRSALSANNNVALSCNSTTRFKSTIRSIEEEPNSRHAFDEDGRAPSDLVTFPSRGNNSSNIDNMPVLLNAKEHAVGYLSRILNARVYEAAIETDLQEAKNLSTVS
jgi:hypothetical protein